MRKSLKGAQFVHCLEHKHEIFKAKTDKHREVAQQAYY